MRYDRLEDLLRLALMLASTAEGLSLADIEREFNISRRTAERMRDAVARAFPQMRRVLGGERVHRWTLPPGTLRALTDIDASELAELDASARRLRARGAAPERVAALERLGAKLRSAMPRRSLARVEPDLELLMRLEGSAARPGPRPILREGMLLDVRRAILGSVALRFDYRRDNARRAASRLAHPLGVLHGPRPYLVASLPGTPGDPTLFRFDRIGRLEVTDRGFRRDESFSLADYAAGSFGIFQEPPIDVCLCFSAQAAADAERTHFHPTQRLERLLDGRLLVRFTAGGPLEMIHHILTWGEQVVVREPAALQKMLTQLLVDLSRHHRTASRKR